PIAAEYDLQHPVISLGCHCQFRRYIKNLIAVVEDFSSRLQERHLPYLSGTRPARKASHPATRIGKLFHDSFPEA
ncbi:hypothetical protein TNCT_40601, partial [Trichonephila clavata]